MDVTVETDLSGRFERYSTCLGTGAHKVVYKAFDQEEGVEVAWNTLLDVVDKEKVLQEIRILESVKNPNIITFIHAWIHNNHIVFITELMTSGTLKVYLQKTKGPVRLKVLKNWARQILNDYLHSKFPPIIHRDLKCENIFINGNNGQAKIGDLGLAVVKNTQHLSSVLGTPEFLAPEVYDEKYDEKIDIYAFGMVLLEIITKEYPYSECTNQAQIYKKVSSGIKPQALSRVTDEPSRAFIELCLTFDPELRPGAKTLLQHDFLAEGPPGMYPESSNAACSEISLNDSMVSFESFKVENSVESLKQVVDAEKHTFLILERPILSKAHTNSGIFDSHCVVEFVDRPTENEVTLKMLYGAYGGPIFEIRFPFKISDDTVDGVVSELIKEALIEEHDEALARKKLMESISIVLYGSKRSNSIDGALHASPLTSPVIKPSRMVPDTMDTFGRPPEIQSPPLMLPSSSSEFTIGTSESKPGSPVYPTPNNTLSRTESNPIIEVKSDTVYPTPKSDQSVTVIDEAVENRLKELQELNLQSLGSMDVNKIAVFSRASGNRVSSSGTNEAQPWPITFGQGGTRPQTLLRTTLNYSARHPLDQSTGKISDHHRTVSSSSSLSGATHNSNENPNVD